MKRFAIAVVVVIGLAVLMGAVQRRLRNVNYGTVKARQFLLTDSKGNVRGGMITDDDGNPELRLVATNGAIVSVAVDDESTTITLTDGTEKPRLQLVVLPAGTAIVFRNTNGKEDYRILVDEKGNIFK